MRQQADWKLPFSGGVVETQPFGINDYVVYNIYKYTLPDGRVMNFEGHDGNDIIPLQGDWDVHNMLEGVVVRDDDTGVDRAYGNNVTIWNEQRRLAVRYCHLSSNCVVEGQYIAKGQVIGVMGATGNTRGAHLHFAVLRTDENGMRLNRDNGFNGVEDGWWLLEEANRPEPSPQPVQIPVQEVNTNDYVYTIGVGQGTTYAIKAAGLPDLYWRIDLYTEANIAVAIVDEYNNKQGSWHPGDIVRIPYDLTRRVEQRMPKPVVSEPVPAPVPQPAPIPQPIPQPQPAPQPVPEPAPQPAPVVAPVPVSGDLINKAIEAGVIDHPEAALLIEKTTKDIAQNIKTKTVDIQTIIGRTAEFLYTAAKSIKPISAFLTGAGVLAPSAADNFAVELNKAFGNLNFDPSLGPIDQLSNIVTVIGALVWAATYLFIRVYEKVKSNKAVRKIQEWATNAWVNKAR